MSDNERSSQEDKKVDLTLALQAISEYRKDIANIDEYYCRCGESNHKRLSLPFNHCQANVILKSIERRIREKEVQ